MKTKIRILAGFATFMAVMAVMVLGLYVWEQQPSPINVAITGKTGLAFSGFIKVDGAEMPVSGVVPANYIVTARTVECRIERQQAGGDLGLNIKMQRGGVCNITTSEAGKGVYAFVGLHEGRCHDF